MTSHHITSHHTYCIFLLTYSLPYLTLGLETMGDRLFDESVYFAASGASDGEIKAGAADTEHVVSHAMPCDYNGTDKRRKSE